MNIDSQIIEFRKYLNCTWNIVQKLLSGDSSLLSDWKQANWEILVEGAVLPAGSFLEVYADGAECSGESSRVWNPSALPTHRISCVAKELESTVDLLTNKICEPESCQFDRLVTWNGKHYDEAPPFDYVLLEAGETPRLVKVTNVIFLLSPTNSVLAS